MTQPMTQPPAPAPSAPVPQHHVPPDHVRIVEVGPRDGLQNDATHLTPAVRAELVTRLAASGLREIEAVSFVHPQRVPQMAGAEEVVTLARHALPATDAPALIGLVLNERGFERAVSAGLRHVRYAFPVTEGFARRNQNQTVEEALALARTLVARAREHDLQIGVVLATSFGCPFDGRVAPRARAARRGTGRAGRAGRTGVRGHHRRRQSRRGPRTAARRRPVRRARHALGAHFHNTRNTGYANAVAAVESGATSLDSSVGGLGGCPFAPRATGNVATEDLAYLLREMGVHTGLDLASLTQTGEWLSRQLGHALPGMLAQAGDFPA